MAHYCPGPRHSSTAGTALPGAEGTPQLSVPAQLGTAQGGRAFLCPGSTGLARESSLSPHRAGSAQHPAHGWAPANRELLPGEPQPTGICAQSLKAERGLGACSKQSQRGDTLQGQSCFPPDPSSFTSSSFQPACPTALPEQSRAVAAEAQQLPQCLPRSSRASPCRRADPEAGEQSVTDPGEGKPIYLGCSNLARTEHITVMHWRLRVLVFFFFFSTDIQENSMQLPCTHYTKETALINH